MSVLKPTLQLRLGQSLAMTPQLQQAIRLLQLSTLELKIEIQQTFESNPMLEALDEASSAEDDGEADETAGTDDDSAEVEMGPVDVDWDSALDGVGGYSEASDSEFEPFETAKTGQESLRDHLLWQLRLSPATETDRIIALAIIDAIDDDGYLRESLESIKAAVASDCAVGEDECLAVLHLVQHFDPPGIAARDLRECLMAQLDQLAPETDGLALARQIVSSHLDLLGARDLSRIKRELKLDDDEIMQAIKLIQSLNPHPGSQLGGKPAESVVPDVLVLRAGGVWRVELNPEVMPRLRINPYYAAMVRRADHSRDNTYMRSQLQEARWFLKSLKSRNETLLRVAAAIVERQREFLEQGDEAMQPLVLKDIADTLSMHESTVSRVTTNKYMLTPRGVYEFKHFFSSHVGTSDGGACSATAIRAMLKKLIAEEDAAKPLSDSTLASILQNKGINVARRTVAKYREAMSIPPSNERRRLT